MGVMKLYLLLLFGLLWYRERVVFLVPLWVC